MQKFLPNKNNTSRFRNSTKFFGQTHHSTSRRYDSANVSQDNDVEMNLDLQAATEGFVKRAADDADDNNAIQKG